MAFAYASRNQAPVVPWAGAERRNQVTHQRSIRGPRGAGPAQWSQSPSVRSRAMSMSSAEVPPAGLHPPGAAATASGGDVAAGVRAQILATEHWSLLATRSMA